MNATATFFDLAEKGVTALRNTNWHECFIYEKETGNLVWKKRGTPQWNGRYSGRVAGYVLTDKRGEVRRRCITINSIHIGAHRVIWEMHHGPIPDGLMLDHINGNPLDNRLENLRLATPIENARNSRMPKTSRSGLKGASWNAKRNAWESRIKTASAHKFLGYYATKEDAHEAYCRAAIEHHGNFARLK